MDPPVPESRVYLHTQCDSETVISGEAFVVASDPLADMTRTWCMKCEGYFPITQIQWADTGETIADYYARHTATATSLDRLVCSRRFLIGSALTGFLVGGVGGYLWVRNNHLFDRILAVAIGGFVTAFITGALVIQISRLISQRVCKVRDTRLLS